MTRQPNRADHGRAEPEPDWTAEEQRAITVLLRHGLIAAGAPITRTCEVPERGLRRAG